MKRRIKKMFDDDKEALDYLERYNIYPEYETINVGCTDIVNSNIEEALSFLEDEYNYTVTVIAD